MYSLLAQCTLPTLSHCKIKFSSSLSLCLSVCLCLYLPACLSVCPCLSLLCISPSLCLRLRLSVPLCLCLSVSFSVYLSLFPPPSIPFRLCLCLSLSLFSAVCLSYYYSNWYCSPKPRATASSELCTPSHCLLDWLTECQQTYGVLT